MGFGYICCRDSIHRLIMVESASKLCTNLEQTRPTINILTNQDIAVNSAFKWLFGSKLSILWDTLYESPVQALSIESFMCLLKQLTKEKWEELQTVYNALGEEAKQDW